MRRFTGILAAFIAVFVFGVAAQAAQVGLKLALLVDVSGSVSTTEFGIQRSGYSAAFRSAAVQNAIANGLSGTDGKVAVTLIYWSTTSVVAVPWTTVSTAAQANALADAIDAAARPGTIGGSTGIGQAINFGKARIDAGPTSVATVMDVSGDGEENVNNLAFLQFARDNALATGVDTINGLVIGSETLRTYYQNNVIGGTNAFARRVDSFDDFGPAVEDKIIEEITNVVPLPLGVWAGLALMGGVGARRAFRKAD